MLSEIGRAPFSARVRTAITLDSGMDTALNRVHEHLVERGVAAEYARRPTELRILPVGPGSPVFRPQIVVGIRDHSIRVSSGLSLAQRLLVVGWMILALGFCAAAGFWRISSGHSFSGLLGGGDVVRDVGLCLAFGALFVAAGYAFTVLGQYQWSRRIAEIEAAVLTGLEQLDH